jgi:hypothetical protein
LLSAEICGLDDLRFGKRRSGTFRQERALRRATREHETQPGEIGFAAAALVTPADSVEKFRREGQLERGVDLVEEHYDGRRRVREHDLPEELDEPVFAYGVASIPPRADIDAEIELGVHTLRDSAEPCVFAIDLIEIGNVAEIHRRDERAGGA